MERFFKMKKIFLALFLFLVFGCDDYMDYGSDTADTIQDGGSSRTLSTQSPLVVSNSGRGTHVTKHFDNLKNVNIESISSSSSGDDVLEETPSTISSTNSNTIYGSNMVSSDINNKLPHVFNINNEYSPFSSCSCDTFSGRVEMTSTSDAGPSVDSGALEIANSLRIDSNEIITNTDTTLYLQHDNNGDLKVDNGTLFVDASTNMVGIGRSDPSRLLDIYGDDLLSSLNGGTLKIQDDSNSSKWLLLDGNQIETNNHELHINLWSTGNIVMASGGGKVGIGTSSDLTAKLNVNGTIRAEEIIVEDVGADYVFDRDYSLMTLNSVENFINKNKHLPDIPSASDAQANGTSLGKRQTLLLQKVEELFLYVIEQDKKINSLEKDLANLKHYKN
jgi:hypothetical protein